MKETGDLYIYMSKLTDEKKFYKRLIAWERSHNNFKNNTLFSGLFRILLLRCDQFSDSVCCVSLVRLFV